MALTKMSSLSRPSEVQTPQNVSDHQRSAAAAVEEERALDQVGRLGAGADEPQRALRHQRLDEQLLVSMPL